jgi:hypothetical protein
MRRLNLCRLFAPLALATAAFSYAQALQSARTFEVASTKPFPPLDMAKVRSGQQRIGMKVDAARVDIGNMPLADIICAAFKLAVSCLGSRLPGKWPAARMDPRSRHSLDRRYAIAWWFSMAHLV